MSHVGLDEERVAAKAIPYYGRPNSSRLKSRSQRLTAAKDSGKEPLGKMVNVKAGMQFLANFFSPSVRRRRSLYATMFDAEWYLAQYPDIATIGQTPLDHFTVSGAKEGRSPHPLFDTAWYLTTYPDVAESGREPFRHYLLYGPKERRSPHPLFDSAWYLAAYPDVAMSGVDPLKHYLLYGAIEDRSPGPRFDAKWYTANYEDVRTSRLNPLLHYIKYGRLEGRHASGNPTSILNTNYRSLEEGLSHKQDDDVTLLRWSGLFDERFYLDTYADVAYSGMDAATHYVNHGLQEGRLPSAFFDPAAYLNENLDVRASQDNPVVHWLRYGRFEGRKAPVAGKTLTRFPTMLTFCNPHKQEIVPLLDMLTASPFTVSFITPTYNTEPYLLRELAQTIENQIYPGWEWIVVDDGSSRPETIAMLQQLGEKDSRIKVVFNVANAGISASTNQALTLACGHYIALVDHDDLVGRHTTDSLWKAWLKWPDTKLFYSDECKINLAYELFDWALKPGCSPALIESTMYINHLGAYERKFLSSLGGFSSIRDGTQDYDIALRAFAETEKIVHLAEVLYLWRAIPGSSAETLDAKSYALERQRDALLDYARRKDSAASVEPGFQAGYWRTIYTLPETPPLVSYIVPTAGGSKVIRGRKTDLLLHCIATFSKTAFCKNVEFIVVHNGNLNDEQLVFLRARSDVRLVLYEATVFNLADKINRGAKAGRGEFLCLLNDDTEAVTERGGDQIISYMIAHPQVGAMAPLCLFENGMVQHNGVVFLEQGPSHYGIMAPPSLSGNLNILRCRREVAAVTGAIMFVRKALFEKLGGFSTRLPLNYNDVDFCLRLAECGSTCVVDPDVEIYHFESASKVGTFQCEQDLMFTRHPIFEDRFFNKGLDQRSPYLELLTASNQASRNLDPTAFKSWLTRRIAWRSSHLRPSGQLKMSVVVPIYNQPAKLLEEMYRSFCMQTYDNKELIVVDDGSYFDETISWIAELEKQGIATVVRHHDNCGIAAANRTLLASSTGDFLIPLDADDFLTVDALQVLAFYCELNPMRSMFYSDEFKSDIHSNHFSPFFKPEFDPVLITNCCYPTHAMALKRTFLQAVNAYGDDRAAWCHDYDSIMRGLAVKEEPIHVPELLYAWRIIAGSTASADTGRKPKTVDSQSFVLNRLLHDKGLASKLTIQQNSLDETSGMWELVASNSVQDVEVALAETLYSNKDGSSLSDRAKTLTASGKFWIAVVGDLNRSEHVLKRLSAPALFDDRVAAVSGLMLDSSGQKIHWSGGLFGKKGIVEPYGGLAVGAGGYHGQLRCQRCIDVPAPFDLLVRADVLETILADDAVPGDADAFIVCLAIAISKAGMLSVVVPSVASRRPSTWNCPLPLDKAGLCQSADVVRNRWYPQMLPDYPAYVFEKGKMYDGEVA